MGEFKKSFEKYPPRPAHFPTSEREILFDKQAFLLQSMTDATLIFRL
jgi:hypothetical protein